jgi:hypothetical protein
MLKHAPVRERVHAFEAYVQLMIDRLTVDDGETVSMGQRLHSKLR